MRKKPKINIVENFGDLTKLYYNKKRKRMEALGRVSPTDAARLFDSVSTFYSSSKTAKGQKIATLAKELATLIKADCKYYADTQLLMALGPSVRIEPDKQEIILTAEY